MYKKSSIGCITCINLEQFANYPNTNLYVVDKLPVVHNKPIITYITYPVIKK